jgi:hypothetical protein
VGQSGNVPGQLLRDYRIRRDSSSVDFLQGTQLASLKTGYIAGYGRYLNNLSGVQLHFQPYFTIFSRPEILFPC